MALLTTDYRAPNLDPTGAVEAYTSGLRIGQTEMARMQEAQQFAAKMLLERQQLKDGQRRAEANHVIALLQDERLREAEENRQAYIDRRLAAKANAGQSQEFTPLPLPGATGVASPTPDFPASTPPPPDSNAGVGIELNATANQGEAPAPVSLEGDQDMALSLAQGSPFASPVMTGPEVQTDAPLLESSNFMGGIDPNPVSAQVGPAEDLSLPEGAFDQGMPLFGEAESPAAQLSAEAVNRINLAGERGGKKLGDRQMMTELAAIARKSGTPAGDDDAFTYDQKERVYRNQDGAAFRKSVGVDGRSRYSQVTGNAPDDVGLTPLENGLYSDPENPNASFKRTILGNGRSTYHQVITPAAAQSEQFQRIGSFPKEGVFRVNPEDPKEVYVEKFTSKGTAYYSPVEPKVIKLSDKAYMKSPDGTLEEIPVNSSKTIPTTIQKSYMDLQRKVSLTRAAVDSARASNDPEALKNANTSLTSLNEQMELLTTMNPRLREITGSTQPATGDGKVYQSEEEARAGGAKAGDIVMMINPRTGKPGRARLQ